MSTTLPPSIPATIEALPARPGRSLRDWGWAVLVTIAAAIFWSRMGDTMDVYERGILVGSVPVVVWLGWAWRPLQALLAATTASAVAAMGLYGGSLAAIDSNLMLRGLLGSQPAVLWMALTYVASTIAYWVPVLAGRRGAGAAWTGSALAWAGSFFGLHALAVRWHESYLMGADVGHIPVSNLYEVFILFSVITALFWLYYEARYSARALGGFVMLVVSAAVGFILWYSFERGAHEIQPLVPALQSWWMKLHVPANFIGYGTFALASMVAFAYLVKTHADSPARALWPLLLLGALLGAEPLVFRKSGFSAYWLLYFAGAALISGAILAARKRIAAALPSLEVLDDVMYKSIAVGFAFFTIATILGALWAAEAWGTYWQWDPKETWALIVWLNYAAWLHMRLIKGLRGTVAAYWALVGLLITGFAFLGVNMFLSGLHSYGQL